MHSQKFIGILYGWIIILGLTLIASFLLALLLKFSSFNEPTLSWVTLIIGLISLFIGGFVAGIKGKAKGWVVGVITGIGFTLFTFLVQYLGYQQGFSLQQMVHHTAYIGAALLGGVVGVNVIVENK